MEEGPGGGGLGFSILIEDTLAEKDATSYVTLKNCSNMPLFLAPFINIEESLVDHCKRLQQYKLAEMKLLAQRRDLQAKVPDIRKCLAIVESLISKQGTGEETIVDFELAEGLYSQARIEETRAVCLWLGANVMLEYSCDEAEMLLKKNLENANVSIKAIIEDLQFLRDQVTITEVTIARVYNWDVHQRRKKRQAGGEGST